MNAKMTYAVAITALFAGTLFQATTWASPTRTVKSLVTMNLARDLTTTLSWTVDGLPIQDAVSYTPVGGDVWHCYRPGDVDEMLARPCGYKSSVLRFRNVSDMNVALNILSSRIDGRPGEPPRYAEYVYKQALVVAVLPITTDINVVTSVLDNAFGERE